MGFVRNRCPKCGSIMMNNCCVGCGFMSNGNYTGKAVNDDKFADLKLYDDSFDDLTMNRKLLLIFLMEYFYFCYRGHLLFGCLVGLVDILISFCFVTSFGDLLGSYFPLIFNFCLFVYFIIKKILYVMFANTICLKLDMLSINRIKKKYSNYQLILCKHKDRNWFKVIICLIIYFVVFFMICVYKWNVNGLM